MDAGATAKDFRVWWANDSTSVIKFSVDKDKEAAFRQTTAVWLEPQIPGARLVGPKWHAVKVDWIEAPLAMDIEWEGEQVGPGAVRNGERGGDVHDAVARSTKAQRATCIGGCQSGDEGGRGEISAV